MPQKITPPRALLTHHANNPDTLDKLWRQWNTPSKSPRIFFAFQWWGQDGDTCPACRKSHPNHTAQCRFVEWYDDSIQEWIEDDGEWGTTQTWVPGPTSVAAWIDQRYITASTK